MAHPLETQYQRAQSAVRSQSWLEAWALLEEINPDYRADARHMGALREDFELLAATVMRHRGELDTAERLYHSLMPRLSLRDERISDVLLGLGECAHARGDFERALRWMSAAENVPARDPIMLVRLHTAAAHIQSHVNLTAALERFEWVQANFPRQESTAWANLLFWHGDALLVAGDYDRAVSTLIGAHAMAVTSGALITAADAMRRLPLARVLNGHSEYALRGLGDLAQAAQLYDLAGDRGSSYLLTETGEVHRSIGQWREAERVFTRGMWASRSINDRNREAHNQLGLFEVSRVMGRPKLELLDEADRHYDAIRSDWGQLHVLICRALGDPDSRERHVRDANALIGRSVFSEFRRERQLLDWISVASTAEIQSEPHLMNYP